MSFARNQNAMLAEMRMSFAVRRPSSFMTITGLLDSYGPPPINLGRLHTRHSLGMIEMERDRRRRERLRR